MSIINTNAKEIHCKILYYGPENSGKKSSLLYIKNHFKESKSEFLILPFKKKLYSLVLSIGKIFNFQTFFHIYNLNNNSPEENKILLNGTDGILFVASSDPKDKQKNINSLTELEKCLKEKNQSPFHLPIVLQYNKKDLENSRPIKQLRMELNKYNSKDFESSALNGEFVLEPLKQLCKLVLNNIKTIDY